jgi:hypothetical protein
MSTHERRHLDRLLEALDVLNEKLEIVAGVEALSASASQLLASSRT